MLMMIVQASIGLVETYSACCERMRWAALRWYFPSRCWCR